MSDTYFLVIGIFIALIGLFLIILRLIHYFTCSLRVESKITGLEETRTMIRGSTIRHYHPVCAYTVEGRELSETAPYSSRDKAHYTIGDTVIIHVNPKQPELVRFSYFNSSIIFDLVILAAGLTLVICYFL